MLKSFKASYKHNKNEVKHWLVGSIWVYNKYTYAMYYNTKVNCFTQFPIAIMCSSALKWRQKIKYAINEKLTSYCYYRGSYQLQSNTFVFI